MEARLSMTCRVYTPWTADWIRWSRGSVEEHAGSINWLWPIVETGIKAAQLYNTRYPSSPQVLLSVHVITACVPAFTSYDVNTPFSFRYYYGKRSHQKPVDHGPVTKGLFSPYINNKSHFTAIQSNWWWCITSNDNLHEHIDSCTYFVY